MHNETGKSDFYNLSTLTPLLIANAFIAQQPFYTIENQFIPRAFFGLWIYKAFYYLLNGRLRGVVVVENEYV